ncbi:MAG: carbohydrate binding family 9 domain-containing protein [Microscillaceae bacterium]|nr:carbohydrate binding family 9 domain-containing protein [Microscillaceae bacterium]
MRLSRAISACLIFGLMAFFCPFLTGQDHFSAYQLSIHKANQRPEIDGFLEEEIWQKAEKAHSFYQNFPFDTSFALTKTEVQMAYDAQFLYLAFTCYDDLPGDYVVQSLRRDFEGGVNDFVTIYLDTFGDGTNGFSFGITPLGVVREALIFNGVDLDPTWDNRWISAARIQTGKWTAEMAIPFSTLRYKPNESNWKVNFARIDLKRNETSTWVPVPRNFRVTTLSFTGDIIWPEAPPKPGLNMALIPYVSGQATRNYLDGSPTDYRANLGGDAKIAVSASLNLDLTFNPDFSQVEVDQQVTNLDRFEIFFPERRQFFIENSDLFSRFGFSRIRPFFSRRIGIGRDTTTGQIVQNPIIYGARLSGKVNKNWRIGMLNMQTARDPEAGIEGQNYTVAAVQRQVFGRSNIGAIFVNRQRTSSGTQDFNLGIADFNRVIGLDYNLLSKDNRWNGKFFYHQVLTPEQHRQQYAHASFLRYSTRKLEVMWNHEYVGRNYEAETGFVPRRNHWRLEPFLRYSFFPRRPKSPINNHGPQLYTNLYWDTQGQLTDRSVELGYEINFASTASAGAYLNQNFVRLFSDFDPTNTDGLPLLSGTTYENFRFATFYQSNNRARFTYFGQINLGSYFNGNILGLTTILTYRIQPFGSVSLRIDHNEIRLPEPYADATFWLIGPRFDFAFTRSLFFSLFTQYNNQVNNINVNARLQWRFQPVSDLFVVYSDNYFPENLKVKNRALVVKITYWFNT